MLRTPLDGNRRPHFGQGKESAIMPSALTVLEPWASGIIHGTKRIENRSWPTRHRGPLVIHAGKGRQMFRGVKDIAEHEMLQRLLPGAKSIEEFRFGQVVGIVNVIDCVRVEDLPAGTPWAEGPWCWVLANPRPLADPIPWTGQLSIYTIPADVFPDGFLR